MSEMVDMVDAVSRLMAVKITAGGNSDVKIPQVSVTQIVGNILNMVYIVVGIVAVIMLLYASILYLTANGEPAKAKKAMDTIIFSVLGLVVVIVAFAITNFVVKAVGG